MNDGRTRLLLREGFIYRVHDDGKHMSKLCRVDDKTLFFWSRSEKIEFPVTLDQLRRLMNLAAERAG